MAVKASAESAIRFWCHLLSFLLRDPKQLTRAFSARSVRQSESWGDPQAGDETAPLALSAYKALGYFRQDFLKDFCSARVFPS